MEVRQEATKKVKGRRIRQSEDEPEDARGASYGANNGTAENRLAVTEAPRDRQDKISGATAALTVAGEELGARAPSSEDVQQQGPPRTRASSSKDSPMYGVGFNAASRS